MVLEGVEQKPCSSTWGGGPNSPKNHPHGLGIPDLPNLHLPYLFAFQRASFFHMLLIISEVVRNYYRDAAVYIN